MKDPKTMGKAKALIERALRLDDHYLPAAYLQAQIAEREGHYGGAIMALHRQALYQPTARIFQMMADISVKQKNLEKAFDYYYTALQ